MKNKFMKKILAFTLSLTILLSGFNIVLAEGKVDPSREGSLKIIFDCSRSKISGVDVKIFRVATISSSEIFTLTGDFTGAGVNLIGVSNNEQWQEISKELEQYSKDNSITPLDTATSNTNGEVLFTGLKTGLYLVLSEKSSDSQNDYKFEPSLVSIPSRDNGNLIYDVTIFPKCEIKPKPTKPTTPTEPTKPTDPTKPTTPTKPTSPTVPTKPSKPITPTIPTKPGKPWVPSLPTTGMANMVSYGLVGIGLIGLGVVVLKKKNDDK